MRIPLCWVWQNKAWEGKCNIAVEISATSGVQLRDRVRALFFGNGESSREGPFWRIALDPGSCHGTKQTYNNSELSLVYKHRVPLIVPILKCECTVCFHSPTWMKNVQILSGTWWMYRRFYWTNLNTILHGQRTFSWLRYWSRVSQNL